MVCSLLAKKFKKDCLISALVIDIAKSPPANLDRDNTDILV